MKTSIFRYLLLSAALLPAAAQAFSPAPGVEVEPLGVTNTLVRVAPDSTYLLLPIQDANDESRINVLVDGKLDRTIVARLARSKTDYNVPLDLTPYRGHKVVLNIITPQGRNSVREASDDAVWKDLRLSNTFDTANREKFRPVYHHTPAYGWMNDPNGMFYKDGVWHLCYQWNPYGSKWQNMTWGHSTSKDLVNWEHQPATIIPDGLGTIFSGSSVVDTNNTAGYGKNAVVALYTSCDASQVQSMAHSTDNGATFTKYAGNPIITLDTEARDPNMFWHEPTQQWVLVLAHALEHEMLIYTSPNLRDWTLQSSFGKGLGCQSGVWECPDLFELPVDGNGLKKWVLICNINPGGPFGGSAAQYFVGDFDGKTFTPDRDKQGNVPTKWLDFGKDNYASVSFSDAPDNRRTLIGWMNNWQYAAEVPTLQYRSANTLPRDVALFTGDDGEIYLASAPSPEVDRLRGKQVARLGKANVSAKGRVLRLPAANQGICEIVAEIPADTSAPVLLTLANGKGNSAVISVDPKAATLSFDRTKSGVTDFSRDFPAVTTAPLLHRGATVKLRIFVDRSSVELFADGGREVMTNLVFPEEPYSTLTVSSPAKGKVASVAVYEISKP